METTEQLAKSEKLTERFALLIDHTTKKGFSPGLIRRTLIEAKTETKKKSKPARCLKRKSVLAGVVFGTLSVLVGVVLSVFGVDRQFIVGYIEDSRCLLSNDGLLMEIARPLMSCDICANLTQVPVEESISTKTFGEKYAYSGIPVLIRKSTSNWTAKSEFSFDFFKDLYMTHEGALQVIEDECQFFPYKTEFTTLAQVFNMSARRARLLDGEDPWYVGWSNCHQEIAVKLRKHYERPYFLPPDSESSIIDWIFMGGHGLGAFIHLDYVQKPSWQAQLSGSKTWALIPPPECEHVCRSMNVTVRKGDIIVLDTNQWYHSTYIHPGEISITIGSEYD